MELLKKYISQKSPTLFIVLGRNICGFALNIINEKVELKSQYVRKYLRDRMLGFKSSFPTNRAHLREGPWPSPDGTSGYLKPVL